MPGGLCLPNTREFLLTNFVKMTVVLEKNI